MTRDDLIISGWTEYKRGSDYVWRYEHVRGDYNFHEACAVMHYFNTWEANNAMA